LQQKVVAKAKSQPEYTSIGRCLFKKSLAEIVNPEARNASEIRKMGAFVWTMKNAIKYPHKIPPPPACIEILIQRLIYINKAVTIAPESGRA